MRINNKISRFLTGPYIFFALIFIPGLLIGINEKKWLFAALAILPLWYLFSTFSGVEINTDSRKFRTYNKHFGLIKTGSWRRLDDYIGLTLVPIKKVYTMYSRSNRSNTSYQNEYRIYLVNKQKRPAIEIKKCKTPDLGQQSLDEFAIWLHLPVYSVKR